MQEIDLAQVKPDLRKILLIGNEGTGKTHFIKTMPKPIYVFSMDKGYLTLAGEEGIKCGVFMDEDRYRPHAYADFKQKFDSLKKQQEKYKWKDGKEEPYKTVAIDSITALSKAIFDHEQRLNNSIDKQGGFGVWGNIKTKLQDVVTQAVLLAEYAVFTAITEPEKDELTGELFFKPSCEGSFRNEMGQWMDAVFFTQVDKKTTGEVQYKILTVGDRRQKAKVRIPSNMQQLSAVEEPDFGKLMNKVKGGKV
jgi:hypothetical protein